MESFWVRLRISWSKMEEGIVCTLKAFYLLFLQTNSSGCRVHLRIR